MLTIRQAFDTTSSAGLLPRMNLHDPVRDAESSYAPDPDPGLLPAIVHVDYGYSTHWGNVGIARTPSGSGAVHWFRSTCGGYPAATPASNADCAVSAPLPCSSNLWMLPLKLKIVVRHHFVKATVKIRQYPDGTPAISTGCSALRHTA